MKHQMTHQDYTNMVMSNALVKAEPQQDANTPTVYRSPVEGMAPTQILVKGIPTWVCRLFRCKLLGQVIHKTEIWDSEKRLDIERRNSETLPFPSKVYPPSDFRLVWCSRCGREWARPKPW